MLTCFIKASDASILEMEIKKSIGIIAFKYVGFVPQTINIVQNDGTLPRSMFSIRKGESNWSEREREKEKERERERE